MNPSLNRTTLQSAAVLLLTLVAACSTGASDKATANYDKQFDFSGVHTVYIEPFSRTDPATIQVSDGQIERINSAIAAEFARKGMEVVASSGKADLFLTWYLITEDPVGGDNARCSDCDRTVDGERRYAKGTLIVDMIDPIRNQPVWRAELNTPLTADPGSAETDKDRRQAAATLFADFPPQ